MAFVDRVVPIIAELEAMVASQCPDLGLEVLVVPFGREGARAIVVKRVKGGIRPMAMRCATNLDRPIEEVTRELWATLWERMRDELPYLREELKETQQ